MSVLTQRSVAGITWNFLSIEIDSENFTDAFKKDIFPLTCPPQWKNKELTYKTFEDGITNKLIGVYPSNESSDNMILLRFNGKDTERFISREMEIVTMMILSKVALSKPVYCQFINGLCYGYAPGRVVAINEMSDLRMCGRIARTLARFHDVSVGTYFGDHGRLNEFFNWIEKVPLHYNTEENNKK